MGVIELEEKIGVDQTVVVNSAMEVTDIIEWTRATTMIIGRNAYTLLNRSDGSKVRSPNLILDRPLVICINKYINRPRNLRVNDKNSIVSKKTILVRDNYKCQYCGSFGDTIDHILPKSRGGLNTWDNLCCACKKCNAKKDHKTPDEAGMKNPIIPKTTVVMNHVMLRNKEVEKLVHQGLVTSMS